MFSFRRWHWLCWLQQGIVIFSERSNPLCGCYNFEGQWWRTWWIPCSWTHTEICTFWHTTGHVYNQYYWFGWVIAAYRLVPYVGSSSILSTWSALAQQWLGKSGTCPPWKFRCIPKYSELACFSTWHSSSCCYSTYIHTGNVYIRPNLIPKPRPPFRHLQYG